MPTTPPREATRAHLFVRCSLPKPARQCCQTIESRLEQLVSEGTLENFTVTSWAKRVPLEETDAMEREYYETFSSWAVDEGVTLSPFFDTRDCYSMETGEKRTELVMPAVCLALYDDSDLVFVGPHSMEDGTATIPDTLDRMLEQSGEDERAKAAVKPAD